MIRKYIQTGTRLPVKFSTRERDLVVERAFLYPEIEAELRQLFQSDQSSSST
jgi:hypothetical protein